MPKKVSENQKKEILNSFVNGKNLKLLSEKYKLSQATIVRQLKNNLGEDKFKVLRDNNKSKKEKNKILIEDLVSENNLEKSIKNNNFEQEFVEVVPITDGIELDNQKDLASEPLSEANLPNVVYMLVDKNIELLPKMLKEYPEWGFLSKQI